MRTNAPLWKDFDCIVIGGAVVGAAIAYGLAKAGLTVAVLDGGDDAFRASRGNFGLVWVQSKGLGCPAYARLSLRAVRSWSAFAAELQRLTGVDCHYEQSGGVMICLDQEEIEFFRHLHNTIEREVGERHLDIEFLDGKSLHTLMPATAPDLPGAFYSSADGTCDPLSLLHALHAAFQRMGVVYLGNHEVETITCRGPSDFLVHTRGIHRSLGAAKIVLAAGLGNAALAPMVGLSAPVSPLQGQIIVTERVAPFRCLPNGMLRPTAEGSLLIAHSEANVGLDTRVLAPVSCAMAARCLRAFPALRKVQIVRTWAALRVMSPDGNPIYDQSSSCPGAFLATCHSGITLASTHSAEVASWITAGTIPESYQPFSAKRFDVQARSA